ncbi:copper amine oxidase N-terminal domain-containing protein [Paenibacillus sp. 2TAB23]|uniref:copper amine oxidase N-terminal domain-containing protein n=1 Tax=Paenibacillus sp. 2TAB23 TaxID=3233004 RepID=UPI003F9C1567
MSYHSIRIPHDKLTNGRLLVPIRLISEYMGGSVQWNKRNNTVIISKNTKQIVLQINSKSTQVNGEPIEMDVPASVNQGVTYVPIRFVGESLGLTIEWLPHDRLALLTDHEQQKRIDIIVEPPLSLENAVALMNKAAMAYDLSTIKQKQQYLRPYFTEGMMREVLFTGGLKQFPDNPKIPFLSFASDKKPSYHYGNENMMFISRTVKVEQEGAYAYENGTLVKTVNGWKIAVARYTLDYPH